MIIDNAGFDVPEMAKMKQADFIELHMSNNAICWGKTEDEKKQWLKNAHIAIVEKAKADAGLTGKSKPVTTDSK